MIETVWLDNPPVNAVNSGIIATLWDAFEQLGPDVRAVVLRGKGERAFSAGADITGFVGGAADGERPAGIQPVADLIEQAPVPVVAAIHGYCLGGGLEIALACDFRIAQRESQLGFPGGEPRPPARWRRHAARAEAHLARARPLARHVGRADPGRDGAGSGGWSSSSSTIWTSGIARYVEPLAKQSPHAIRQIKELLLDTRDERSDAREVVAFAACLNSDDGQEGVAAFLEKRAPTWSGT